jgi:hypothetical protein
MDGRHAVTGTWSQGRCLPDLVTGPLEAELSLLMQSAASRTALADGIKWLYGW